MNFITIEDLSASLRKDVTGDTLAEIAIAAASDLIRKAVNQKFHLVVDDVVSLDSEGTEVILLPELPVIEVAAVNGPGNITLVEGDDYVVDLEMGAIKTKRHGRRFLKGRQAYGVAYTHGYLLPEQSAGSGSGAIAAENLPADLRALCMQVATRLYEQSIYSSEAVGATSATYSAEEALPLTPQERDTIVAKYDPAARR